MPDELLIGFNPMPAAQRVAQCGSRIRSRLLWLGISLAISVWIWVWKRNSLTTGQVIALFAVGLGYSLVWIIIAIVAWVRAKMELSSISEGLAARVDRSGISLQAMAVSWPDVAKIQARKGRLGNSPTLRIMAVNGMEAAVPISYLDVMPGTIDASIRTFSRGTHWIDTSKLGN